MNCRCSCCWEMSAVSCGRGILLEAVEADPMIGLRLPAHRERRRQHCAAGLRGRSRDRRAAQARARRDSRHLPRRRCAGAVPARQAGHQRRFPGTRPAISQCGRRFVALHEPLPPVRVPDGDLQSRRSGRAGSCETLSAVHDHAANLPEADRILLRELSPDVEKAVVEFGRPSPPSPKRGLPARSLTRTAAPRAAGLSEHRLRHERDDDRGAGHLPRTTQTRC